MEKDKSTFTRAYPGDWNSLDFMRPVLDSFYGIIDRYIYR